MKRTRQKNQPLIPTKPEKQPKPKNKPHPTTEHGMRKHRATPSPQRNKKDPNSHLKII
jgi:hypothetical protein